MNLLSFSGWAVFLSNHVGYYLKPINNLWILSFISIKSLCLTEKYWFQNEFALVFRLGSIFKQSRRLLPQADK